MKKRVNQILSIVICCAMMLTLSPAISAPVFARSGVNYDTSWYTADVSASSFSISTAEQLRGLAEIVNGTAYPTDGSGSVSEGASLLAADSFSGDTITLTSDIELGYWQDKDADGLVDDDEIFETKDGGAAYASDNWTAIGKAGSSFRGTFDGGEYTIRGIYLNNTLPYQGLFGSVLGGAVLKNINLKDCYMNAYGRIGGIAGAAEDSTIENCTCSDTVRVSGSGDFVGGIMGYGNSTVKKCDNSGMVSGTVNVGGIAGYLFGTGIVTKCHNAGDVVGTSSWVGGIVGYAKDNSTVEYSLNTGSISGSLGIGGIAGRNDGTLRYCDNMGSVNAKRDSAGGIAGYHTAGDGSAKIQYCANQGTVTTGTDSVGGIAGYVGSGVMEYSYNTGIVTGNGSYLGSIIGRYNSGTVTGCYYDRQLCTPGGIDGSDVSGKAEGKLTANMLGSALSSNLGTASHWTFADGLYPRLADPSEGDIDMDGTDAAYAAAAPILLSNQETVGAVKGDFSLSTANDVEWTSSKSSVIRIDGSAATILSSGSDVVLTAKKNSAVKKITISFVTFSLPELTSSSTADMIKSGKTYLISNADGLRKLAELVNAGTDCSGAAFRLTADIALGYWQDTDGDSSIDVNEIYDAASGGTAYTTDNWTAIGKSGSSFRGSFDGDGHTVSGIRLENAMEYQGLFGNVLGGTLKNIKIEDCYIHGLYRVGSIAGAIEEGTVKNCTNSGIVKGSGSFIGGIVGYGNSAITDCSNPGTVAGVDSAQNTGGITGYLFGSGSVTNCSNTSNINSVGYYTGGIVGYAKDNSSVTSCQNTGDISGRVGVGGIAGLNDGTLQYCDNTGIVTANDMYAGGIAGLHTFADENAIIRYCNNEGAVSSVNGLAGGVAGAVNFLGVVNFCVNTGAVSTGGDYAGGISGINYYCVEMENCYNTGNVSSTGSYVGGIASSNGDSSVIESCYNTGSITGLNDVGGLVGSNGGVIQYCYQIGVISGNNEIGSITGMNSGNVQDCYYDKQRCTTGGISSKDESGAAEGKLTAGMTGTSLSGNLGTGSNWTFTSGLYPRLADPSGISFDMNGTDTAYLAAAPVFLASGDIVSAVASDFTVSTLNSVAWNSSDEGIVRISGETAALTSTGSVMLTAARNGKTKTIALKVVPAPEPEPEPEPAETYTITFDTQGGSSVASIINITAGAMIAAPAAPSLTGYSFAGWYRSTAYNDQWNFTSDTVTANLTLHAKWTADTPVSPESPGGAGGSGSGSGGGSSHAAVTGSVGTGTAATYINGTARSVGSVQNSTNPDNQTVTTVTLDEAGMLAALKTQQPGSTVWLALDGDAEIGVGVLTGQTLKAMSDKTGTLVLKSGDVTYTIPASEIDLDAALEQLGSGAALSDLVVKFQIAEPSEAIKQALKHAAASGGFVIRIPAVEFSITVTGKSKTVELSRFHSYIRRMVAVPKGVDPVGLTTGIVIEPSGAIHPVPTSISEIGGSYYVVMNSVTNSVYAVIEHPVAFSDVEKHWAKDAINDMGSRMIVSGVTDTTYEPDRKITRAEFAAMIVRALGLSPEEGSADFKDVSSAAWYGNYVKTAYEYGILTGYQDGTFHPDSTITREQAMAMIARAMKITGLSAAATNETLAQYKDASDISSYAADSVAACMAAGLTKGTTAETVAPKENVTRAEVAVILQRLLQNSELINK